MAVSKNGSVPLPRYAVRSVPLAAFSTADCVAFFHLDYTRRASETIYYENLGDAHLPGATAYLAFISDRSCFKATLANRATALTVFRSLGVNYDG